MASTMKESGSGGIASASGEFLGWLEGWVRGLAALDLAEFMQAERLGPENLAVVSADLVNGFCYEGPLASPRIAAIVEPSAALFSRAHEQGVRDFVLVQEYHTEHAAEFEQYGPHCIRGTREADTVQPLKDLPFSDLFRVVHKNSLHPAYGTDFDAWLAERPGLRAFIVVGDCTDLCTYQVALHLKLSANARDERVHVIVPADCVDTYDLPVDVARNIGAMPHDANLLHPLFLYHMALNGATVCASVR
ncbi:MAG TPA: isochorismatase family cysteine hydrolase [Chloroflexia bacterium]|nr:isochorismatase family cysteine hydrolase [Chloroflexia bacterium]